METKKHKTSIGGQALIEGVMMRGPRGAAVAVRLPGGDIDVAPQEEKRLAKTHKWARLPLLRGVIAFFESLKFGYRYLMYSAEKSATPEELEASESKVDRWLEEHFSDRVMPIIGVLSTVLGVALALVLFMYLPIILVDLFDGHLTNGVLESHNLHPLFEGIIKIILLILYMWVVSKQSDIHRVFQYHGSEHKTIFCYENGLPLTVENVREQSRFHPRCGTSFTIVMLLIGILLGTVLVLIWPGIGKIRWLYTLLKLLMLPLVMGLGYEFIKYAGKHDDRLTRILSAPGLWMQRITTQEPEDDMIEVAIAAFNAVRTDNPEDDEIK